MTQKFFCLLLTVAMFSACQPRQAEGTATLPLVKRDFAHVLTAEGTLVPLVQETLTTPERTWGTLEMLMPEGQAVKKGQLVARISTREAAERMAQYTERMDAESAELMKQRAELPLERFKQQSAVKDKEREAKLSQLDLQTTREGPRLNERVKAKVDLEVPSLQQSAYPLAEKETLYAKGYLSEQELLEARLEYERLGTARQTAALALQQQSLKYRQPEIRSAELKVRSAQLEARISKLDAEAQQGVQRTRTRNQGSRVEGFQRRIGRFQARLEGSELHAPFDGVVLYPLIWGSQAPHVGMQVWGGLPVVQVARTSQLKVESRINEFDIPHVKLGQKVNLSSPGYPGKVYVGKVTRIQKLAKYKDENKPVGLKYFDIEISLDRQAPELRANTTLQAAIGIETLRQVWIVPLEALHSRERKQAEQPGEGYYLRLQDQGRIREREVQVLARSGDFAAVKGQFSGSERVILAGGRP
ncbi:MAG TPA: HlyD family efflux transporter periplasmic adaptor subunit [Candidatus Obscuribacterales bacterium]